MKNVRIVACATEKERAQIVALARRCGLSQAEYLRQRALGYAPVSVPPDAFFDFCEKADALLDGMEADDSKAALSLIEEVSRAVLEPVKEKRGAALWQPQDSGPSTTT